MAPPVIALQQINKSWADGSRSVDVLRGAELTVQPGELVAILGASGSGKSTLLHIIGGLDRRFTGHVEVAGQDLGKLNDTQLSAFRARTVGFVFQAFNLLPAFSALENVLLPSYFGEPPPELERRAKEALDRVGLSAKTHRRPGELSGGERQRVAIARALFMRPPILLADEPTGNLDAATGTEVISLFRELNRNDGMTLLIVTHEERVSAVANRVLQLTDGRLVEREPSVPRPSG
jgi:putative ABC transport system ATP-binding protein